MIVALVRAVVAAVAVAALVAVAVAIVVAVIAIILTRQLSSAMPLRAGPLDPSTARRLGLRKSGMAADGPSRWRCTSGSGPAGGCERFVACPSQAMGHDRPAHGGGALRLPAHGAGQPFR